MRRMHRAHRRSADALLPISARGDRGAQDRHDRRPESGFQPPVEKALDRNECAAMRLLPIRHAHGRSSDLETAPTPDRCGYGPICEQHLPMRDLPPSAGRDSQGGGNARIEECLSMNQVTALDRRQFVLSTLAAGGVLVVGLHEQRASGAEPQAVPWDKDNPAGSSEFTPWLSIAPDDTVIVRVTTPDIGNGVVTQAGAFVMEELGTSWDKIRPEYASTNRDYRDGHVYSQVAGIIGYFSGRSTGPDRMKTYMQVAASARERLKAAAAAQWGVKTSEIDAQNSVLTHKSSGRTLRFGEVVARAAKVKLEVETTPKDRSQWAFLTKTSPAKVQIPEIVNGAAVYGIDVRLTHQVYAALRPPPGHGGKLRGHDADAVKHLPGVLPRAPV